MSINPMDIGFDGQPFVEGAFGNGMILVTMDIAFNGQPFVREPGVTIDPPVTEEEFVPWICVF